MWNHLETSPTSALGTRQFGSISTAGGSGGPGHGTLPGHPPAGRTPSETVHVFNGSSLSHREAGASRSPASASSSTCADPPVYRASLRQLTMLIYLDEERRAALQWWGQRQHLELSNPLGPSKPDVVIHTDSSMTHWGAHAPGFQASGDGHHRTQGSMSITQLERLTVFRALQADRTRCRHKVLLIATGICTIVAYIFQMGGTKYLKRRDFTKALYEELRQLRIVLRSRHILGRLNRLTALLSKPDNRGSPHDPPTTRFANW